MRRPSLVGAWKVKDAYMLNFNLHDLVAHNNLVDRAYITDPAGVERYDDPHDKTAIGKDFSDRDWYKRGHADWEGLTCWPSTSVKCCPRSTSWPSPPRSESPRARRSPTS